MTLLSLHCRNSEALRCSVLQTGSVVYGSLSITDARKCYRDPCRLSFPQRACSQAKPGLTHPAISQLKSCLNQWVKYVTLILCLFFVVVILPEFQFQTYTVYLVWTGIKLDCSGL